MLYVKELEKFVSTQKGELSNVRNNEKPSILKDLIDGVSPFKDLLDQENSRIVGDELKFSNHAITRLHSRNIHLTNKDKQKIVEGINKLKQKGAKESLVMLKDLSMIVSVNNKTVVTAMEKADQNSDGIFTNIDSAIIIENK